MSRIENLMAADKFFSQKATWHYINRVQKERYSMTPKQAYDKLYYENVVKKRVKVSTKRVEFTERQLQIAVAALVKGKQ